MDHLVENSIYIGGLSRDITDKELEREFSEFGRIEKIRIKNKFAFIEYDHVSGCEKAIETMHDRKLDGRRITVEMCKSNSSHFRHDDGSGK